MPNDILILSVLIVIPALAHRLSAQSSGAASLRSGRAIFEAGCAGCHGGNGKGAPESTTVFERPDTFPDFTECDQTTPEDNRAWKSIIRDGGPRRGFSQIMPSFGGALTSEQIDAVVGYLRSFCKSDGWPRGELNLPRPLATEKAFPETESVITTTVNATGAPGFSNEIVTEQRLSKRNQLEISLPVNFVHPAKGLWYGGVGDVGIGLKRLLASSMRTGSILSVQGEAVVPVGSTSHGLSTGATIFEAFALYGQLLPYRAFLQMQGGGEVSVNTAKAPNAVFYRAALGRSFNQNAGAGRLWSPMMEFVADRDLQTGAKINCDLMPELQVTLSKRQHVRFNVGVRIPASNTAGRPVQLMFYLLWDRQDGGLLKGWR
jgi:Cytochrome C oxidase, cbb3-type, subunit III